MDSLFFMSLLTWIGIFFCVSQSAMFSGMNLALLSISRLRLEVEAGLGPVFKTGRSQQKKWIFLIVSIGGRILCWIPMHFCGMCFLREQQ